MKKYLLNIQTGTIHDGEFPCKHGKDMNEENQKYFDIYEEAVNYFGGKHKKRKPCGKCLKSKR